MIVALLRLIKEHKLEIVTTHDLINWADGGVQLCSPCARGSTGSLKIAVWTGCPTDFMVPRKSKLMDDVKKILLERPPVKQQLNEGDIIDRYIAKGKLWLVTRDFKTVCEESVRLTRYRCGKCRAPAQDVRETKLFHRQNDLCTACFEKLIPKDDQFEYARSTWVSTLHRAGWRVEYDPIMGTVRKIQLPADLINRMRHENGIYGVEAGRKPTSGQHDSEEVRVDGTDTNEKEDQASREDVSGESGVERASLPDGHEGTTV